MAFTNTARSSMVADINMTPLVDVMLVLLVIFMVSAPLISRPLNATLPQHQSHNDIAKPLQMQLEVMDDGSYRLDGRLVSRQQLGENLREAAISDERVVLTLRATSNADYQSMAAALAEARENGIAHIGMQP